MQSIEINKEPLLTWQEQEERSVMAKRIVYTLRAGFRPFLWLSLLQYRENPMRYFPFSTLDVRVDTVPQLRMLEALLAAGNAYNFTVRYVFTSIFFTSLVRDLCYSLDQDNRLGIPSAFPLWPTHFSDTRWTGNMTSYDEAGWRLYAIAMYSPVFASIGAAVFKYATYQFQLNLVNDTNEVTRLGVIFNEILKKPKNILTKIYYSILVNEIGHALIYLRTLNSKQAYKAIDTLKQALTLPNLPFLHDDVRAHAYEFINQHKMPTEENDPGLYKAVRSLLSEHKANDLLSRLIESDWEWRARPQLRSRQAAFFSMGMLFTTYHSLMHMWLLGSAWYQQIKLWHEASRCNEFYGYVYHRADYVCGPCPDWQHEVNTNDIDDIQACVTARLAHPHSVTTYRQALERGAALSTTNDSWPLDLTIMPWASYTLTEWQELQRGLDALLNHHNLKSLNLSTPAFIGFGLEQKLPKLVANVTTELDLSGLPLSTEVVSGLSFAPSLVNVTVANCDLKNDATTRLLQALNQTQLQHLDLRAAQFNLEAANALVALNQQNSLQQLCLAKSVYVDDSGSAMLQGLAATQLHTLDLSGVIIQQSMLPALSSLINSGLHTLKLNDIPFEFSSLQPIELVTVLQNSSLTQLELNGWYFEDFVMQELLNGTLAQSVESLSFRHSSFGPEAMMTFAQNVPSMHLQHLDLNAAVFSADELFDALPFIADTQITSLDISNLHDKLIDWQAISASLLHANSSEPFSLSLRNNEIGSLEFIEFMSSNISQTRQFKFDLSGNNLDTLAVPALARLIHDHQVTDLQLDDNQFSDHDWQTLAVALRHSTLETLSAYAAGVQNQAAAAIAAVITDTPLTSLRLGGSSMGAPGVQSLIEALYRDRLPQPEQLSRRVPSIDWRRHLPAVPVETKQFSLQLPNANLDDVSGRALCMAQVGFFSQGARLDLAIDHNPFLQVDAQSCGIRNETESVSTHFALMLVLLHLLWQGCGFLQSMWPSRSSTEQDELPAANASPRLS